MSFDIDRLLQKLKLLSAADFPKRKIVSIMEDTPLIEILNKFGASDPPILPVINKKQQYIGIITLRDLLFLFQRKHTSLHDAFHLQHRPEGYVAADFINLSLPIIYDADSLERITEIMSRYETSVLPRASHRKEQISGLLYLKDIFTVIRTTLRKLLSEAQRQKEQGDVC